MRSYNINDDDCYKLWGNVYDGFFKSDEELEKLTKKLHGNIKSKYSKLVWYDIYDFLEFLAKVHHPRVLSDEFRKTLNIVFKEEMSGYRFIDNYIAPIIDDVEIKEVEEALGSELIGVKSHISNSLELLSDRENPNYTNSIKESISAVESAVCILSGKPNVPLNRAIQNLPFNIDKNLKQAYIKIYSWTSSADGIRHGVTNDKIISSFGEAKYMLVSCSAFINYLLEKKQEINKT
jgi:hypothetical protein